MAQHRTAEQEAMAVRRGIRSQQDIVMREVVALGVLKRQLNVVELRIGGNVHRQTRPGKVAGVIETHVMLNHRRVGPFGQFKMVAIVGGVDFIALYALAGRWLRLTWICVTLRARLSVKCRKTSG